MSDPIRSVQRKTFEKWLFQSGWYGKNDRVRSQNGIYLEGQTEAQWQAWLAAQSATDMTDETKVDGMTLAQVRDSIKSESEFQRKTKHIVTCTLMDIWAKHIDTHLAAQSAMRVDEAVLDAPARVGAVAFGKGVAWSSVIGCAQRAYNAKPMPRETVEELKRTLSKIKSDAERAIYGDPDIDDVDGEGKP